MTVSEIFSLTAPFVGKTKMDTTSSFSVWTSSAEAEEASLGTTADTSTLRREWKNNGYGIKSKESQIKLHVERDESRAGTYGTYISR